jgi:hypothetical protein
LIGDGVPLAQAKAQRIVDGLNDVRRRQDRLDLTFLTQRARREAREYLESLEGMDQAAAASVVLYSLGGHAIPVDDLTLYVLRKEELVDASADAAEVQGFLERHVHAADARTFVDLLGRFVASHGSRVAVEQLDELLNPPPPAPEPEPEPAPPAKKKADKPKAASRKKAAGETRKARAGKSRSTPRKKRAAKPLASSGRSKAGTAKRAGTAKKTKARRG